MKYTRIAVFAAALLGATTLATPTAGAMEFNPDACLDPSQMATTGPDGKTRGVYRIPVPGKSYCNDIYIPYVK